jgi:Winged helix-turn helix
MNYNAKYVVRLTEEERAELQGLVRRGKVAAAKRSRAQVLLKADAGLKGSGSTDEQVAQSLEVSTRSVNRVRKAYVEEGLSAAIERQPRRKQPRRKLDGAAEAHLVAGSVFTAARRPDAVDFAIVERQARRAANRRIDQP